ncbi:MAG: lactate utilization protein [Acidobacteriota bacterium]|nr:lactate utilization protein [Acidobacteriota bacterium]
MASEAKSAIFDAIRQNLTASLPFDAVHEAHQIHRQKIASLLAEDSFVENVPVVEFESDGKNLIENFRENLEAVGGKVTIVKHKNEAVAEIQKIIDESNVRKIAASDANLIGEIVNSLKVENEISVNAAASELFECDLGITGAQFGIAETGTLVLESEREFNRLTSLVPPIHVCVLKAKNIRQTLGETLTMLEKDLSRTITFITGPSRTSDIELTLAIGVHGPAELFVILIDEM